MRHESWTDVRGALWAFGNNTVPLVDMHIYSSTLPIFEIFYWFCSVGKKKGCDDIVCVICISYRAAREMSDRQTRWQAICCISVRNACARNKRVLQDRRGGEVKRWLYVVERAAS